MRPSGLLWRHGNACQWDVTSDSFWEIWEALTSSGSQQVCWVCVRVYAMLHQELALLHTVKKKKVFLPADLNRFFCNNVTLMYEMNHWGVWWHVGCVQFLFILFNLILKQSIVQMTVMFSPVLVGWFVSTITQKALNGFWLNFQDSSAMKQGTIDYILWLMSRLGGGLRPECFSSRSKLYIFFHL